MFTLSEKIILWYLPTTSGFKSVMQYPNLKMRGANGRYHLLKELEHLEHLSPAKGAPANKLSTEYKKQC